MRVRFQADADFNQLIVKATLRREPSIDFRTAQAAGLPGLKDHEVLALAARESRILVTHDRKTMPAQFAEFVTSATSAGVLIVPQKLLIPKAVEDLVLIWAATEAEEWINRIRFSTALTPRLVAKLQHATFSLAKLGSRLGRQVRVSSGTMRAHAHLISRSPTSPH